MSQQDHERGAAAVEFALVLPVLLLLVFGIVEFGRAYNIQTSVTAAARQGARVMALDNDPTAARSAAKAAAQPYTVADGQITVGTCPVPNTTNALVTVTVRYPVTLITGWFGTSINLTGKGVMRCNG